MSVTIYSKYAGEVQDVFRMECGFRWQLEDGIEEWAKRDLGRLWV